MSRCEGPLAISDFAILLADDWVFMVDSIEELWLGFDKLWSSFEKEALIVNLGKTEVIVIGVGGVNALGHLIKWVQVVSVKTASGYIIFNSLLKMPNVNA